MFYKTDDNVERPLVFRLGPFTFSLQEVFRSVVSLAVVVPVNLLIIELFRRTNETNIFGALDRIQRNKGRKSPDDIEIIHIDQLDYEDKNGREKPKGKLWPRWLRVVAWMLIALAVLPSAFFVILYSLEWGQEKANQWLTAFTLSLLESLLVFDPLKVS